MGEGYGKVYRLVAAQEGVARTLNEHRRDPRQTIPSRAKTASKIVELTWLSVYELRLRSRQSELRQLQERGDRINQSIAAGGDGVRLSSVSGSFTTHLVVSPTD